MNNSCFGEMTFNTGWKTTTDIILFGKSISIIVKAKAYYEKDGITYDQEAAFSDFSNNKEEKLRITEKLLCDYSNVDAPDRFVPKTLLFERDGSYALLFDDKNNEDNGIAVCLAPSELVLNQDEYL